jgi:hypothetical protein
MHYNSGIKVIIGLVIAFFAIWELSCCRGIMAPAPLGIHGHYSSTSDTPNYQVGIGIDSILMLFSKANITIKTGRLNDYDAPWDSLSYVLSDIPCDKQQIEAYIEFKDKTANTTFRVLWFNAAITKDDKLYQKLTESYYKCFESFLRGHNLIK